MWTKNVDNNRWYKKLDILEKDEYDSLKQEIEKTRLYSACLSGSTYVSVNNLNDIYDIIKIRNNYNWCIGTASSPYSIGPIPSDYKVIDNSTFQEYYNKYTFEYGMTLKNKFTPIKLINDVIDNYYEVDVATTEALDGIGNYQPGLIIDGIILKDGHRVLVKDQKSFINLPSITDPDVYFNTTYFIEEDNVTSIRYSYYNSDNGIYTYKNSTLVRTEELNNYSDVYKYSISVKLGNINSQTQWHLNRLKNEYYPLYQNDDPMEFASKKNWVIRNRIDYNNIYEIVYNDIYKHATQSYTKDGYTYTIPSRVISIGEFGMISIYQGDCNNIVNNRYKVMLRSITETKEYYWICGDKGTLLKVSKLDLTIERIELNEFNSLTSIDFVDDLRGILVGKFNCIYFTENGGYTWSKISKSDLDGYSYNKVIYKTFNTAYIGGDSGVFIEMEYKFNEWSFYKRKISKHLDLVEPTEEYLMVEDINDMVLSTYDNSIWSLTSSSTQSFFPSDKEVLVMVTNNSNLIFKDINNFIRNNTTFHTPDTGNVHNQFDFLYISFTQSFTDINSVAVISGSSSIYISSDKIYKLNISDFNFISPTSNSITSTYSSVTEVYDIFVNKIFDFNGENLYMCGNNSSLYYSGYTASLTEIDADFNNRYKSKMLFLDYDIASKLNFFDDQQNYRLPNSLTFSSNQIGSYIAITNKDNEYNWLNYYKDVEKTFEYYTSLDTSNQVLFSTTFSYGPNTYFSFTASDINTSIEAIKSLAPDVDQYDKPIILAGTGSISGTTYSGVVFAHRYMIIFKKDINYPCDIGDVLYIECDLIRTTFVVNKRVNVGFDSYLYCYSDLDQTIVNDLKNYNGVVSVINLNKFSGIGLTGGNGILYDISDEEYWNYDNNINPDDYFSYGPLAAMNGGGDLLVNFSLHPVSIGYKLSGKDGVYTLETKYNNKTAYYNMQSKVIVDAGTYYMDYTDAFLKFGYKPTYNLYDYLSNISTTIFSTKRFSSMPRYQLIPGNNGAGASDSTIYLDTNTTNLTANKLLFGSNLYFEWNSIWINTFVDVILHTSGGSFTSNKMFVMKKYYDSEIDMYVIEFHKKLEFDYYVNLQFVDILSRNTLPEVSDDLQILNNIHRSETLKELKIATNYYDSFINLENELKSKFTTDSYAKILLSDKDIKENLSGILFTDSDNELSISMIKLENEVNIPILSTSLYATASTDYLLITCSQSHNLSVGDGIIVTFNGLTFSSNQWNQSYFGYQVIKGIINDTSFYTDKPFGVNIPGVDEGNIKFIDNDPFLNYQAIDLMDLGVDKNVKRSVEIKPENIKLSRSTYSIINLNTNKYRYELVDGMSITDVYDKYPWLMEGMIYNAVIGENENGVVWYSGDWDCGRWFGGTWISGRWISGDWYNGIWNSYKMNYKLLNVEIEKSEKNNNYSKWYGGRWFGGIWNGGTWYDGRMYSGDWNDGIWYNGIWNDGNWKNGQWKGGIWVYGRWDGGIFNCDTSPSYWINGTWYGGDFENGMWYNGQFLEKEGKFSRFGTKAFNTRTAIWHGGKFSNGEFHSYLNKDDEGSTIASEYNKYSIWNTGIWNGGDWYGGVAYAINFNSGNWYGGVTEEIQVTGINITQDETKVTLNGIFKFNIGDDIWIVSDGNTTPYDYMGSLETPGVYKVLFKEEAGEETTLLLNKDMYTVVGATSISGIETGLRLTSIFRNSNWKSGVWTNGIFESGYFEGGIWYGGVFKSNWGR